MTPSLKRRSSESTTRSAAGASARRVQSAGSEYGYPRGHLHHLNDHEEEALKNFKLFLIEKHLYRPGPPPSHDDQTLLRFLRARRWVVPDAYKQYKETEDWRAANHLDVLYSTIDLEAYDQSRRLYPQWTGRRDKRGIPLYVFEIRHLDTKTIANYEKLANSTYSRAHADGKTPPRLLRLFALYENLTRFVQPLCTEMSDRENAQTPITLSTNIVDVSGVSLRQFWNLKAHMQVASTLATAHYPETLDRIFIIGAPFFFSTVWGWIKRWFDPITVSKIFILDQHEVLPTLRKFVDIKNIPKSYGGELEWGWGQWPSLDPAIRQNLTWEGKFNDFPKGPVYWQPLGEDRLECVAVGSVDQVERMEHVCTMPRSYNGQAAAIPNTSVDGAGKANGVPPEVTVEGTTSESKVPASSTAPAPPSSAAEKSEATPGPVPEVHPGVPSTTAAAPATAPAVPSTADNLEKETDSAPAPAISEVQGVQNLSITDKDEPIEVSEKTTAPPLAAQTTTA